MIRRLAPFDFGPKIDRMKVHSRPVLGPALRPCSAGRRRWVIATLGAPALALALPLPDLIRGARPAIAAVGTFNPLESPRFTFRGTGFFVGDGSLLVTCRHVLPDSSSDGRDPLDRLAVALPRPDGTHETRPATLLASARQHDLALLRVAGPPASVLRLGPVALVPEGTDVALIGFPLGSTLGLRHVTHRGIVASIVASSLPAATARQLPESAALRLREGSFELLQLDVVAYPGNSGGPLIDIESGAVVGVLNMALLKGNRESALSQPTGISYGIPVRHVHELLGQPTLPQTR